MPLVLLIYGLGLDRSRLGNGRSCGIRCRGRRIATSRRRWLQALAALRFAWRECGKLSSAHSASRRSVKIGNRPDHPRRAQCRAKKPPRDENPCRPRWNSSGRTHRRNSENDRCHRQVALERPTFQTRDGRLSHPLDDDRRPRRHRGGFRNRNRRDVRGV